jgi:hypothetical protein
MGGRMGEQTQRLRGRGTLGGKFNRRQTGTADWDEAKFIVASLQQSGLPR